MTKTEKPREFFKQNPLAWIFDEINEMRDEKDYSPQWHDERMDVLGLINKYVMTEPDVLVLAALYMHIGEVNKPIDEDSFTSWNKKQTDKGRDSTDIKDIQNALIALTKLRESIFSAPVASHERLVRVMNEKLKPLNLRLE